MGRTQKVIKAGKISGKDYILTVEEKQVAHIGNKTKISLEMTPGQRYLEARRLKAAKMRMKKLINIWWFYN